MAVARRFALDAAALRSMPAEDPARAAAQEALVEASDDFRRRHEALAREEPRPPKRKAEEDAPD